jgi:hypothetical protein
MKELRKFIFRKILIKIFAEVSTTTFAKKNAPDITIFDAISHYAKRETRR